MYLKTILFTTIFIVYTGIVQAETSIGLDINDKDVELLGETNFNTLTDYSSGTTFILSGNYLYVGEDNYNNEGKHLFTLGFRGENHLPGVEGLSLGVGIQSVFADSYISLPLSIRAKYALALIDTIPTTSFFTSYAYAPSVLSFSDGEGYSEWRVGADMELFSNTHIFVGYRDIDTDYSDRKYNFNERFYGGLKLSF